MSDTVYDMPSGDLHTIPTEPPKVSQFSKILETGEHFRTPPCIEGNRLRYHQLAETWPLRPHTCLSVRFLGLWSDLQRRYIFVPQSSITGYYNDGGKAPGEVAEPRQALNC
jgi:hypothetical protein